MRINNTSSPSFGALKQQNMQALLEPLKEKALSAFSTQADSFSKFSDKHKVDVSFMKYTPDASGPFFGRNTEESIALVRETVERTAADIRSEISGILNPKANDAVNSLANDLMTGADEAVRASASDRITEAVNGIVDPTVREVAEHTARIVERETAGAADVITRGASNPDSDIFTVIIKGQGDNPVEKRIEAVKMPTKKGILGRNTNTIKGLFKELRKAVKQVEKLSDIKDKFGI